MLIQIVEYARHQLHAGECKYESRQNFLELYQHAFHLWIIYIPNTSDDMPVISGKSQK